MPWTLDDAPDQRGRVVVITGASAGLGLESARLIASRGATVVMACRAPAKGEAAAAWVRRTVPGAALEVLALDLASLESVARFAEALHERHPRVDVLLNNAGVSALPKGTTPDGFELQLGTNHLGHFALTGRLLPQLERAGAPRVVTVSSLVHRMARLDFGDLQSERAYDRLAAYAQSKLANLLFAFELERWLRRHGKKTSSLAAHPGYSHTTLLTRPALGAPSFVALVMKLGNGLVAQATELGAMPQVRAALDATVPGGQLLGPDGLLQLSGFPRVVAASEAARDEAAAARLWQASEALTGVAFTP